MSLFDSISNGMSNEMAGITMGVSSIANRFVPPVVNKALNHTGIIGGDLMNGDLVSAGRHLMNTGILGDLGGFKGIIDQALFWATPTPLMGGLSPYEAKQIYQQTASTDYAKKNLFLIEVNSALYGDISDRFNLFSTDVEYAPSTITAEKRKIGGTTTDSVQSSEPVDLSITTLDDSEGFLRNWFNYHAQKTVHTDGTVGLPAEYAIRIKIVHNFLKPNDYAYQDIGLFRPQNMNLSLSRHDDALQELTMQFSQLDTFMRP